MTSSQPTRDAPRSVEHQGSPGPVMVIGGAEDKLRDRVILTRFIKLAGGLDSRIVVISTASSLGEEATDLYRELFGALGASDVVGLRPLTRRDANDRRDVEAIDRATGVFLTGGNQLRLSSVVNGTALGGALLRAHARGVVIAGTSAGASAVSTHMMAFGASGATPKHRMAQVSAGLGILHGLVIDQHFEQRTRLGRLLAVVAQSPDLVGIGLDEDTSAIVWADGTLEVLGRGAVTVVDGSNIQTDAFYTKAHRPMMVSGAILHSLPSGYRFDLHSRTLLPPVSDQTPRAQRVPQTERARLRDLAREIAAEGADSFVTERRRRPQRDREASE